MEEVEDEKARRLPPGPHGLPPDLVERNQRERLIAAMAEECAAGGYAATSVVEVSRRAGVSTASFYKQFADKRACLLASFEELFGRLLEEIERACEGEARPAAKVKVAIGTAVGLLAADPPTARLLAVEIAAVGPEGVRLQHDAIDQLAVRLRDARGRDATAAAPFPSAEWTAVAAMVALVSKRVVEGESPGAAELEAVCARLWPSDGPR